MANIDYTKGLHQLDMGKAMSNRAHTPVTRASAGTTIGKLLTSYFANKSMDSGLAAMGEAEEIEKQKARQDVARMLEAYQGFNPKDQAESGRELTSAQDTNALMEAMMISENPDYQKAGLVKALKPNVNRIGKYNPGDYTPESWAKWIEAGGADNQSSALERYEPPWIGKVGGITQLVNRGDNPGETQAISTLPEEVKAEAEIAAAVETAKKRAIFTEDTISTAYEMIDKVDANIRNLQGAVQAIKDDAYTGPIASLFPTFRESTVRLENIQKRLGLDVVGATTFGALSKGELDLSKDVALPTGLKPKALAEWIEVRIAAQSKVRDYLEKQAHFLSKGNTVADWREFLSTVPEGVTEADIKTTMHKHGLTRHQVLGRLNLGG